MSDDTDPVTHASALMAQVRPVLDRIADKWTIMILAGICSRPVRFNELRRRLDGITHKGLSDALKRMERNGLVTRTVLETRPIGVEDAQTPLGLTLREPFEALIQWATTHGTAFGEAHAAPDPAMSYSEANHASPITKRHAC